MSRPKSRHLRQVYNTNWRVVVNLKSKKFHLRASNDLGDWPTLVKAIVNGGGVV